jgi:phage-related protein
LAKAYRFKVEPVVKANGNCPSKEFYDGLYEKVKAKFIAIFKGINQSPFGVLRDTDKFEKLKGRHTHDLWEIKVYFKGMWYRMLCFRDNSNWMLTHGFMKNRNNTPLTEIQKGGTIKQEYYENKKSV